jgi:hypothetical protein
MTEKRARSAASGENETVEKTVATPLTCGVIQPLSAIDGCTAGHWSDVFAIIKEAVEGIESPTFTARMVSDADDVGVIHKRIVSNIYQSDIVVCDVSARNPNVMFELGMRLAFDRPVVLIKDDKTDYAFDTGLIEHIPYPRDLRYQSIQLFQQTLAQKVSSTFLASQSADHSSFLKNFGAFQVAKLDTVEAKADQILVGLIDDLRTEVRTLRNTRNGLQLNGAFNVQNFSDGRAFDDKEISAMLAGSMHEARVTLVEASAPLDDEVLTKIRAVAIEDVAARTNLPRTYLRRLADRIRIH